MPVTSAAIEEETEEPLPKWLIDHCSLSSTEPTIDYTEGIGEGLEGCDIIVNY